MNHLLFYFSLIREYSFSSNNFSENFKKSLQLTEVEKNLPNFDLNKTAYISEWLANEFGAQYLTLIGDIPNTDCSIKTETIPLS